MGVFSNSAMSLDGKLGTFRHDHVAIGSARDREWMGELRARADAVLVGGATWRNWALPLIEPHPSRTRPLLNAVLTRSGVGPREGRFYAHPLTLPVFLGGPDTDLEGFSPRVQVHRAPSTPTVAWAVDLLRRVYGVRHLLVEGGGDLIFQLLEADLLDELYVTVCPWLIGGRDAPTLADGAGFEAHRMRALSLVSSRTDGDEIYLHYRVRRDL